MADSFHPLICRLFLGTQWELVFPASKRCSQHGSLPGIAVVEPSTSLSSSLAQDTGLSRRQHGFKSRRGRFLLPVKSRVFFGRCGPVSKPVSKLYLNRPPKQPFLFRREPKQGEAAPPVFGATSRSARQEIPSGRKEEMPIWTPSTCVPRGGRSPLCPPRSSTTRPRRPRTSE